jgi:phosphoserine phosphatase RsbU/P
MRSRLRALYRAIGWVGLVFLLLLAVQIVSGQLGLSRGSGRLRVAVYLAGILLALRLARLAYRRGIWRLRNRLLAAYLFMAVVPILLIATLASWQSTW